MCSYLFARTRAALSDASIEAANEFARLRGPDRTGITRQQDIEGFELLYLHNLLDISGTTATQPNTDPVHPETVALFNGEIYNFASLGDFRNDTSAVIPTFHRFGAELASHLDGEFAITIHDQANGVLHIFTDPFLTKPLYWGTDDTDTDFAVATCESTLKLIGCHQTEMVEPNSAYQIHFTESGFSLKHKAETRPFDLRQHKSAYSDWYEAFRQSVTKRAMHGAHRPLVFLSSGYDSGAICAALNAEGVEYDTLSIEAGESLEVLNRRIEINQSNSCGQALRVDGLDDAELKTIARKIESLVEPFVYVHEDKPGVTCDFRTDGGALGGFHLAGIARSNNHVVNLSGSGADEIMSDYGFAGEKFYYHSEFGGLFPEDLASIFPWKKFYGDTQRSYLFKDEYILGSHGIEGRYPFLDWNVVQEFLWLTAGLKNNSYKGAIEAFLKQNDYPYEPLKKRGFSPRSQPVPQTTAEPKQPSLARRVLRKLRVI